MVHLFSIDPPFANRYPFGAIDRVAALGMPAHDRTCEIFNPSTEKLLAELPNKGDGEARAAIDEAARPQGEWPRR